MIKKREVKLASLREKKRLKKIFTYVEANGGKASKS